MFTAYLQTTKSTFSGLYISHPLRRGNASQLNALIWSSLQFSSENWLALETICLGPHTMPLFPPSLEHPLRSVATLTQKSQMPEPPRFSTRLIVVNKVVSLPLIFVSFKDSFCFYQNNVQQTPEQLLQIALCRRGSWNRSEFDNASFILGMLNRTSGRQLALSLHDFSTDLQPIWPFYQEAPKNACTCRLTY